MGKDAWEDMWEEEETAGHFRSAWTLREDLTGIKGSAKDVDGGDNNLVFYRVH